jgi:hypothetical protein
LTNVQDKDKLCGDFIQMSQKRDQELLQEFDQSNDSFWSRALDQVSKNTKRKVRYAVDVEATLFTPESNNPW